jgi:hypothetical protein
MKPFLPMRPFTQSTPSTTEVPMKPCLRRSPSVASTIPVPRKKMRRRFFSPRSFAHGLARELELLAPLYAKLHTAHPELSAYPTLQSLLDRLTTGPRDHAKKELVSGIISIRQSSPHRLWVAIVLRAFWPMLVKQWKELFGSDCQERLALLLLSFQTTVERVDARREPLRVALRIRLATRRRVFVALAKEVRWSSPGARVRAPSWPRGSHFAASRSRRTTARTRATVSHSGS